VEAALNTFPGVLRSAVIGRTVQGVDGGEEVIAYVQPAPGVTLAVAELADHAARNLAPYKQPSQILLVPEMPITPTGKVRKDELVKMMAPTPQR